ncbi:MAG: peptidoglycan-binding protein, partial [Gammaproteobacteria bacterium]|nr:peptidoglycan-binding protein [Gammaproteobacteria bacterium]
IDVSANGQATTELLDTLRATQIEVVAPSAPSSIGSAPSPRATAPDADSVSQEVIRAAEVALKERGFDPGPVDGVADAATIAAVKTFQEGVGMVPDGVITPALAQRLQGREIGAAAPAAAVTSSVAPRSDPTTAARGDANVFEAQQLLNQLGYDAGVPDGQVGSRTVSAVKAYQSQIGNPVTGNIGLGLLGNLRDSRSRGEVARPMMAAIQRDLTRLGYTPGPADGLGGPRTERAIRAFQRDAGLDVDGRATLDLATRLETLASQ